MSATIEHLPRAARTTNLAAPAADFAVGRGRSQSVLLLRCQHHSVFVGVVALAVALMLFFVVNPALGQPTTNTAPMRITGPTTLAPATLAPGRPETHLVSLTNASKATLRYTLKTRTTGDARLASSVSVVVKRDVTNCSTDGFNRSGNVAAFGTLDHFRGTAGSFALPPRTTETLCVQQRLPGNAGNSLQNLGVQAKLVVDYTQDKS